MFCFCDKFFHKGQYGAHVLLNPDEVRQDLEHHRVPGADVARQQERDKSEYHITILTHIEARGMIAQIVADLQTRYEGLSKTKAEEAARHALQDLMDDPAQGIKGQPCLLGLGRAADAEGRTCHFYVAEWPEAQEWRVWFGLPPAQLHATVAFSHQDLVGVNKGIDSSF